MWCYKIYIAQAPRNNDYKVAIVIHVGGKSRWRLDISASLAARAACTEKREMTSNHQKLNFQFDDPWLSLLSGLMWRRHAGLLENKTHKARPTTLVSIAGGKSADALLERSTFCGRWKIIVDYKDLKEGNRMSLAVS